MENYLLLLAASFCAVAISFTVTIAGMFEPLREWIYDRSKFFGQLITCPWCFGHYVVFIILLTSNIPLLLVSKYWLYNFLFTSFVVIGLSSVWYKIILVAFDPVAKIKAQREVAKLRQAKLKNEIESGS